MADRMTVSGGSQVASVGIGAGVSGSDWLAGRDSRGVDVILYPDSSKQWVVEHVQASTRPECRNEVVSFLSARYGAPRRPDEKGTGGWHKPTVEWRDEKGGAAFMVRGERMLLGGTTEFGELDVYTGRFADAMDAWWRQRQQQAP
jgi:hypothetical protein